MGIILNEGTQTTVKTTTDGVNGEIQHVRIDGGTYNAGTPTIGSMANLGVIHNAGTLANGSLANIGIIHNAGSIAALPNLPGGTMNLITRIGNVGTLESGSVAITAFPSGGTLLNLATGTLASVTTLTNLTIGSVHMTVGTMTTGSLANVTQIHNAGTLQAGTLQINPIPIITPLIQGTLGTAGGSLFGTLSAASGAGTKHYISGYSIVVQSGTPDVRILTGTAIQGTGVLTAGQFPPGGGIARDLNPPFVTGTNSEIIYHFVGAGSAFIVVNYWKGT